MDDGGVVDLFLHSPKENIGFDPSLYANHTPVANMVLPIAIMVLPVAFQDNLL